MESIGNLIERRIPVGKEDTIVMSINRPPFSTISKPRLEAMRADYTEDQYEYIINHLYAEVDREISKHVRLLNKKGYRTIFSCQGHLDAVYKTPYGADTHYTDDELELVDVSIYNMYVMMEEPDIGFDADYINYMLPETLFYEYGRYTEYFDYMTYTLALPFAKRMELARAEVRDYDLEEFLYKKTNDRVFGREKSRKRSIVIRMNDTLPQMYCGKYHKNDTLDQEYLDFLVKYLKRARNDFYNFIKIIPDCNPRNKQED